MDAQSLTDAIARLIDAKLEKQAADQFRESARRIHAADEELEDAKRFLTDTLLTEFPQEER